MDCGLQKYTLHNGKTLVIFCKDNVEMLKAFARIREYYKSKDFKGVIVDNLEQIIDLYKNKYNIDYVGLWDGLNVPKSIVFYFAEKCNNLNDREKMLVELLRTMPEVQYIIAYITNSSDAIPHGIAHSMYHNYLEYRIKVNEEISRYDIGKINKLLSARGKHESIFLNEINAYSISGMEEIFNGWFDSFQWHIYYKWYYRRMIEQLEKIYNDYMSRNQ